MTKSKKPSQFDWQARELPDWNVNTFMAYIADKTKELYGVDYAPGGTGVKTSRYSRERGMMKNAIGQYGNAVVKRFIDICWREYRTNKPEQFPYPSWTFMYSCMDRYFPQAQSEVARESRREERKKDGGVDYEELADWL
jgi:hypothetical protein